MIELEKARDKLEGFAITDKLTQAYNRRKFDEILVSEIERARRFDHPFSLAMFDIDSF